MLRVSISRSRAAVSASAISASTSAAASATIATTASTGGTMSATSVASASRRGGGGAFSLFSRRVFHSSSLLNVRGLSRFSGCARRAALRSFRANVGRVEMRRARALTALVAGAAAFSVAAACALTQADPVRAEPVTESDHPDDRAFPGVVDKDEADNEAGAGSRAGAGAGARVRFRDEVYDPNAGAGAGDDGDDDAQRELRSRFGDDFEEFDYDKGVEHDLYDQFYVAKREKRERTNWELFKSLFSLSTWRDWLNIASDNEEEWGDLDDLEGDEGESLDLLPPPAPINAVGASPRTLVFDPIDVLLRPQYSHSYGWRFMMRPGMLYFLHRMALSQYELVAWTRLGRMAAESLAVNMNRGGDIKFWLFKDAMKRGRKDLSRLGRNMERVIMLESHPWLTSMHPENTLNPPVFWGDPRDTELLELTVLLEDIQRANPVDVRPILAKYKENPLSTYEELFGKDEWAFERAKAAVMEETYAASGSSHRAAFSMTYAYRIWQEFSRGMYHDRMIEGAREKYASVIPEGDELIDEPVRGSRNLPSMLMTHTEATLNEDWPTFTGLRPGIRASDVGRALHPKLPPDDVVFWDKDTRDATIGPDGIPTTSKHEKRFSFNTTVLAPELTGFSLWLWFSKNLLNSMDLPPGLPHGPLVSRGFRETYGASPMRVLLEVGSRLDRKNRTRRDWYVERGERRYGGPHRDLTSEEIDDDVRKYEVTVGRIPRASPNHSFDIAEFDDWMPSLDGVESGEESSVHANLTPNKANDERDEHDEHDERDNDTEFRVRPRLSDLLLPAVSTSARSISDPGTQSGEIFDVRDQLEYLMRPAPANVLDGEKIYAPMPCDGFSADVASDRIEHEEMERNFGTCSEEDMESDRAVWVDFLDGLADNKEAIKYLGKDFVDNVYDIMPDFSQSTEPFPFCAEYKLPEEPGSVIIDPRANLGALKPSDPDAKPFPKLPLFGPNGSLTHADPDEQPPMYPKGHSLGALSEHMQQQASGQQSS